MHKTAGLVFDIEQFKKKAESTIELLKCARILKFENANGCYVVHEPGKYREVLRVKARSCLKDLADFVSHISENDIKIYESSPVFYRSRCRLGVSVDVETNTVSFVMWKHGCSVKNRAYFNRGESFILACPLINIIMQSLLSLLENDIRMGYGLELVNFLTSTTNEAVLTFFYSTMRTKASDFEGLRIKLCSLCSLAKLGIIVKCKAEKEDPRYWPTYAVLGDDYVTETYDLDSGEKLHYKQLAGCFSNPNPKICQVSYLHHMNFKCN